METWKDSGSCGEMLSCIMFRTRTQTHTHIHIHARSPVVTPGVLVVTCQLWNPLKYSSLQSSESELPGNEQCHIAKQLALTLSVCTTDSQMHTETHSFSAFSALWHKLRKGTGMLAFKRHTECVALLFTRAHTHPSSKGIFIYFIYFIIGCRPWSGLKLNPILAGHSSAMCHRLYSHACLSVTVFLSFLFFFFFLLASLLREAHFLSSHFPGSDDVKAVWESREGACMEC